ncbi:hypothetical protein BB558_003158 [Smittium angustum]|nr:hypothetical protein BB558_003158 [Smittium angustum]
MCGCIQDGSVKCTGAAPPTPSPYDKCVKDHDGKSTFKINGVMCGCIQDGSVKCTGAIKPQVVYKLLGWYKVLVSELHVSEDLIPINILLDTASYLAGIVAPRASIIDDIIAQHAPLNQRQVVGRVPLVRRSGVR